MLERSVDATAAGLGGRTAAAWRRAVRRRSCATPARALRRAARPAAPAAPPARPGALRPARRSARRRRWRAARFRGRARAGAASPGCAAHSMLPLERPLSAAFGLDARRSPGTPSAGRSRAGARSGSPTRWRPPALARRRDRDRRAGRARSTSCRRRGAVLLRRHAAPAAARSPATRLPAGYRRAARALPLRARRLQARLGARRADPVDGAGVRARRDGAPRRHARRDRGRASAAVWRGRAPERPFVLLAQQSLFDPTPRAGGQAHGLGLLPRAERLDGAT